MRNFVIEIINIYQKFFSPDHSFWAKKTYPFGFCKFSPSCSEYAKEAITKHGLVHGLFLAIKRVLRCNPFSEPAHDPIQ